MRAFPKLRRLYANIRCHVAGESGETLTETLVSILIGTLALIMLANAITTAKNIVVSSEKKMDAHYAAEDEVVAGNDDRIVPGDFTVELKDTTGSAGKAQSVTVYSEAAAEQNATSRYQKRGEAG